MKIWSYHKNEHKTESDDDSDSEDDDGSDSENDDGSRVKTIP
jgi:hypothetical protein